MFKKQKILNGPFRILNFWIFRFRIVSDFDLRISDFDSLNGLNVWNDWNNWNGFF